MLEGGVVGNIFIVESPFQLSNALLYHKKNDSVIVRLNGENKNDFQIEKMLSSFNGKVYIKKASKESKFDLIRFVLFFAVPVLIANLNKKVIIGNYNSLWMRVMGYLFNPFHFAVLDDGLITIRTIKRLDDNISRSGSIKKRFLLLLAPRFITQYKIYSNFIQIYNQEINKRKRTTRAIKAGRVCFIGSPLFDKNVLTFDFYVKCLAAISDNLKRCGYSIEYYPHRSEKNISYLNVFFDDVIKSDDSIEVYYSASNELPEIFVSFYSSALLNLRSDYPECKFISYKLDCNEINGKFRYEIMEAYNFLAFSGIEVVTI